METGVAQTMAEVEELHNAVQKKQEEIDRLQQELHLICQHADNLEKKLLDEGEKMKDLVHPAGVGSLGLREALAKVSLSRFYRFLTIVFHFSLDDADEFARVCIFLRIDSLKQIQSSKRS